MHCVNKFTHYVGNYVSREYWCRPQRPQVRHETEILGRGPEAAESELLWENCKKNCGHKQFFSVPDFADKNLPYPLTDEERDILRAHADRTVRVRVQRTSQLRPDSDELSAYRGTDRLRVGSGYMVGFITPRVDGEPCPCGECDGKVMKQGWTFSILTASHVVFNTEEAKETRVDLFYDDEDCRLDGRMKTAWALEIEWSHPSKDVCKMVCVTHDEATVERIKAIELSWLYFREHYLPLRLEIFHILDKFTKARVPKGHFHAVIISHPHGQPKKVTVGTWIGHRDCSSGDSSKKYLSYLTATCPGSSGAPVLLLYPHVSHPSLFLWRGSIHSGTYNRSATELMEPVNYGSSLRYVN